MSDILNPRKYYFSFLKDKNIENAGKYFDALTEKSQIDKQRNIDDVHIIRKKQAELADLKKTIRRKTWGLVFLILATIIAVIAFIVLIVKMAEGAVRVKVGIGIVIGLGLLSVFFVFEIINLIKKILEAKALADKLKKEIEEMIEECWRQMAPLNRLYDYPMPSQVFNSTMDDIINLDDSFDVKKCDRLVKKYGYIEDNEDEDTSTVYCQSGEILGNPFLVVKQHSMRMYEKTYEGSITITWTTTYTDSEGHVQTEHHSQTLTAYVTAPAPGYSYVTHLIYGNDAAPNLTFSRKPSGVSGESEQKIDRVVKKQVKKMDKQARKELTDNDPTTNYTRFSHDEFEALFGGTNRDNEIEYRLLFTPLAIQNELDIIKNKEPYGDDFYLSKEKKINTVTSIHSQAFNYDFNPQMFRDYSVEDARERFVTYCHQFFQAIYFDLAPLISIPLYQQTKSLDYIYGRDFNTNYTISEHELMANAFNPAYLRNPLTTTDTIMKTTFTGKDGDADRFIITARSFQGVERVTYVNKMGGDGRMHSIPVHWIEYFPLTQETPVTMSRVNGSIPEFIDNLNNPQFTNFMNTFEQNSSYVYKRGFISTILANPQVQQGFSQVKNYFKGIYSNSNIMNNINNNTNSNRKNLNNTSSNISSNTSNSTNSNIANNKEKGEENNG